MPRRYLKKVVQRTYQPGEPGSPSDPGTAPSGSRERHCSWESRTVGGNQTAIVAAGNISEFLSRNDVVNAHVAPFGYAADGSITYYRVTYGEETTVEEEVCHSASAELGGTNPTPGESPTPGQWETQQNHGWNAGAYSQKRLDGDLAVTFSVEVAQAVAVALTRREVTEDWHYRSMPFVMLFRDGNVSVYENGERKAGPTAYDVGDRFSMVRSGGRVQYRRGSTVLHENTGNSTGSMVVTAALYAGGDRVI